MTTKAVRKADKKAKRIAEAQRVAQDPASAILGKSSPETEEPTSIEEMVNQIPEPDEKAEETVVEQEAPKQEATTLEDMVAGLSPEVRDSALELIGKLRAQAQRNEANKKFAAFDKACKDPESGLAKVIADLANTHGVDLSGRKLVISYPKGEFGYTNAPIGKKGEGKGRNGFPSSWGEAEEVGEDGKTIQKQSSPSKLAEKMGLQVEGMRDMKDVFENPKARGTKAELPKNFKVEAQRGEFFRVVHIQET